MTSTPQQHNRHTGGEDNGHGRGAKLRPFVALALAALISLVSTGCGSNTLSKTRTASTGTGSNSTAVIREKAVKFVECMRDNGVSAFPDPDASGELTIDGVVNGSSLDTSSAVWKQAVGACRDLQPPGFTGTEVSPEKQEVRLKFAQCMRDNGIKDFPDPTADGPLIDTSRVPGSPGARSIPGFKAAQAKCSDVFRAALPDTSGDQ